jgi:hypothetical protein
LELKARKARGKREGVYQSGGNMDGFNDNNNTDKKKPAASAVKRAAKLCPFCNLKGHTTKRSKKCLFNPQKPNFVQQSKPPPEAPQSNNDDILNAADDVEDMDSTPFQDELPGLPFDQNDDFHDCGTWSEDDDRKINERYVI